jgi:hypothetical protein
MKFANYYSLVFSVFFLFVLLAPTIVLLNSDKETFSILEETEKKDIEDIKEFVELDFDKTNVLYTSLFRAFQSLSFVFHSEPLFETHLENTSPPPKRV